MDLPKCHRDEKTVTDIINKRLRVYLNAMLQVDPENCQVFIRPAAWSRSTENADGKNLISKSLAFVAIQFQMRSTLLSF